LNEFWTAIFNYGFAAAGFAALAYANYRALIWIGIHVAKPLVVRHVKFLDDLSAAISLHSQAMQAMITRLDNLNERMERLEKGRA
jgi:hypothetical protein